MLEIRPLQPSDDRSGFRSGNPDLDRFFLRFAGQNQFRHHIGVTYVAVDQGRILGFGTVSLAQIEIESLPARIRKNLPRYPLPVLRLARLAVAEDQRKKGIGNALVRRVFELARELSGKVGCVGAVVDAKPEAIPFYRELGFTPLELLEGSLGDRPAPVAMFLPIQMIP